MTIFITDLLLSIKQSSPENTEEKLAQGPLAVASLEKHQEIYSNMQHTDCTLKHFQFYSEMYFQCYTLSLTFT